ncbi:serine/threonine-protein phosphatase [Malacoplasma penetrans]|uniref:Protein phosphatase n=1 Tax=Malacoplasma penetrans (strain HF-2) TaxID=272633 RepID=Q8EVK1_MALP2|nr:PP2C family serine/threonine-protein phosphatase [Malacoplasma penetrans]RXY96403.1 serine/threonine-protein phosphatase [Malacoplasma penetrans]BAC44352.1 protein phosphatase [Malacoplasma penetrans HF-2]
MQKFNLEKFFNNNNNFIKLRRVLYSKSDTGTRQKNEDYAYCGTNKLLDNLLIVCDGIGSCRGSEKAAEIVAKTFVNSFLKQEYLLTNVNEWFEKNIERAKFAMIDHVLRFKDHNQMCTTLVLALSVEDTFHVFWIGDSRAYLIDKKSFEQLSDDHNLLNYLIKTGTPQEEIEAKGKKIYSLMNYISINTKDKQEYDYVSFKIKKNSFVFLASDGFYNFFSDLGSLYDILSHDGNAENLSNDLVNYALNNQSNDNISFSYIGFLKD